MKIPYVSAPLALVLIFIAGLSTHLLLWHLPLVDLNSLMTPEQNENFTDPNYYLYVASTVCRMPSWTTDDITVTWSATGVIGYLVYGCKILGTEFFYIVVNPLLVALSIGLVVKVARSIGLVPVITLPSILLLPYTFFTLSLPGKETISVTGTLLMLAGLMLLSARRQIIKAALLTVLGLVIIGVNRMHEAGVLAAFCVLWLTGVLRSPWRILVLVALGSYFATDLLRGVRLNQDAESLTDEILWSGSSEGKALELDALFGLLRSDNLFVHALLGVFRVGVVLFAPLSSLVTPPTDAEFSYFLFRDVSQRLRLIDFAFCAYVLYLAIRRWRHTVVSGVGRDVSLMPTLFFYMIYVITFFGVSQKSRYIFQYTPVLLLWFWLYGHERLRGTVPPATTQPPPVRPSTDVVEHHA